MQRINWRVLLGVCGLVLLMACGKSKKAVSVPNAITIDSYSLQQAFAGTPELQASANRAVMCIRYADYNGALAELDKLAAAPGLTDPQKKTVTDVTSQVKTVKENTAAAAPQ
ncbi:MAG: hypothetical protein C5B50_03215 [Verrucomicrobia bacterium]|nr:MAG: hypothetical protein C5B50_03215 [Verrucomicrobiota bacterium]